ncbi:MAG: tRNA (N(6)-L-threonylcarbamoyladenosine(37)-C(2))-methylthiotransferase MtaB [Bacteroidia bacterium]|nr:tRNA (N(6)-L-threonylcarbamoyladenosine(37)-C(2))-methylthiotransferase MtaB [Bacteroidia bacterium]MCZ2276880.1 tRNA (N(6)-L-threonylcarbamoyladenosine(37)-C(2))-methylthiotransferase MtaB [Bacteroidia bacterium]
MNCHPTVAFHTLGCKLNYTETGAIAKEFEKAGYNKVSFDGSADVYVINTCSVTENADKECKTMINRAMKKNPDAFIAVIGCYAQLKPEKIAGFDGVDMVVGASSKFSFIQEIKLKKNDKAVIMSCDIESVEKFIAAHSDETRTRAFLKIQDGCDYNCSYCTIPLARGKSRSNSISNILKEIDELALRGVKEVVLTGVNIGDFYYYENEKKISFTDLLHELEKSDGIERFRISSIEPNLVSDEIIRFVAQSKKFMPHFHIPLQSGSDRILNRMRRRYRSGLYASKVEKIKSLIPYAAIGGDVITGFAGETEEDFQQTYNFIEKLGMSYLHVFTYSERDHTHALLLDGVVPYRVRKERTAKLRALSEKLNRQFREKNQGRKLKVLFENSNHNGLMEGYSENYIRISAPYDENKVNSIIEIEYEPEMAELS